MVPRLSSVEPLASHDTGGFDCGSTPLNEFLKRFALQAASSGGSRTYVVHRGGAVVGYYSLAAGSIEHEAAPPRVTKGMGRYPIPVILLTRLAVDLGEQGRGLGSALLADALRRALGVSQEVGARAFIVHAEDEEARRFYEHFDFERSPTHPMHLFLLMKDVVRLLGN